MARRYPKTEHDKAHENAKQKARYAADPQKYIDRQKLRHSGFTPELAAQRRSEQGGLCGICKRPLEKKAHGFDRENLDHCHTQKVPRGILCSPCNTGLGQYEKRQREMGLVIHCYEEYISRYARNEQPRDSASLDSKEGPARVH